MEQKWGKIKSWIRADLKEINGIVHAIGSDGTTLWCQEYRIDPEDEELIYFETGDKITCNGCIEKITEEIYPIWWKRQKVRQKIKDRDLDKLIGTKIVVERTKEGELTTNSTILCPQCEEEKNLNYWIFNWNGVLEMHCCECGMRFLFEKEYYERDEQIFRLFRIPSLL